MSVPFQSEDFDSELTDYSKNPWYTGGGVFTNYKANGNEYGAKFQYAEKQQIIPSENNTGGLYLLRRDKTTNGDYPILLGKVGNYKGTIERTTEQWYEGNVQYAPSTTTNDVSGSGTVGFIPDRRENVSYTCIWVTNLPIFDESDSESIAKYIENGDISGAINYDELSIEKVIGKIYVDYSEPPALKFTWNIDGGNAPSKYKMVFEAWNVLHTSKSIITTVERDFASGSFSCSWGQLENMKEGGLIDKITAIDVTMSYGVGTETITYYDEVTITLSRDGNITPTSTSVGKHEVQGIRGTGEDDDGYQPTIDDSNATDENVTINVCDLLTSTYKVTEAQLQALGSFLWSADLFDNIRLVNNSPIENIVSVKALPIDIDGSASTINLGNVNSGVSGIKINNNYVKKTIGSIFVPRIYSNFADYEHCNIYLYLPLIGTITDLNPREIVGYKITLKYCFDVISGDCLAMIFNNRGSKNEKVTENCIGIYKGNASIDIPLTSSNRAQLQAGYIADTVSGVASIASGNVFGAVFSGLSAISRQNISRTNGAVSGVCAQGLPKKAYLTIVENATQIPSGYAKTYGRPCNLTKKLGSLSGFTVVDKGIHLSHINCTYEEKEEMRDLLAKGVIF